MTSTSQSPNASATAIGPWLVPPLLRYVAGRGDRVYVLLSGVHGSGDESACALARSDDAGKTWREPAVIAASGETTVQPPGGASKPQWLAHAVAVDVADADKVYVTLESLYGADRGIHLAISTDGGTTFGLVDLSFPYRDGPHQPSDVACPAAGVVGIANILPIAPDEAPPDLLYWRVDARAVKPSRTTRPSIAPSAVLPLVHSGRVHSARLEVDEGGLLRVFYASRQGIHFRESVDGAPFGPERDAELANRCMSELAILRAGKKTLLIAGAGTNTFAWTPPVLHVAADAGAAFEPRALQLSDDTQTKRRLRIEPAGRTGPGLLARPVDGGTRLFIAGDGGEPFSSVLVTGRTYGAYQAHDTGHGLVVVARAPVHAEEEVVEAAEPCVAYRIGFASDAPDTVSSIESVPIRAREQYRPSFREWLGLSPVRVMTRGKRLRAASTTVSRVAGPAIGIQEWPTSNDGQPLQHILTLDLRDRRSATGPAAIALFALLCDDFGQAEYRVLELSEADLVEPREMAFPGDAPDSRLAAAFELRLKEPTEWCDAYCGGQPNYVQGTVLTPASSAEDLVGHLRRMGSTGEFICQFGESLFPDFGFGDGGMVYIHRRRAWIEMC